MNTTAKKIMMAVAIFSISMVANAQTAQDSIKALQAENARLRADLENTTLVGDANKKGCMHLHLDTLRRTIKGVESCNGFYAGVGAGYDYLQYQVNDGKMQSTGCATLTAKFGYRQYWSRQELSFTGGFGQKIEGKSYTMAKVRFMQYFDFLRFKKAEKKHCRFDPYIGLGASYNMITSKTTTGVGDIPYEGNNFRAELSLGTWYKVCTFNNGRTTQTVHGRKVSLKRKSEFFLDLSVNGSYGTLSKPRLVQNEQPIMKLYELNFLVTGIVKF